MSTEPGDAVARDLTVAIVSYNSAARLPGCVAAFLAAGVAPERLWVVDNDSRDDSLEQARAAGAVAHATGRNGGFAYACNHALARAETPLIAFVNPDARIERDALALLVRTAQAHAPAIAGPQFEPERPRGRRHSGVASDIVGFLPQPAQERLSRFSIDIEVPGEGAEPVAVDYVVGALMVADVAALRRLGGFDERFFLYSEEDDLCRRAVAAGMRVLLVPGAQAHHEETTSSAGTSGERMATFRLRSRYLYYRKHHSRAYAEAARLALIAMLSLDRASRALLRRPHAYERSAARALIRPGALPR